MSTTDQGNCFQGQKADPGSFHPCRNIRTYSDGLLIASLFDVKSFLVYRAITISVHQLSMHILYLAVPSHHLQSTDRLSFDDFPNYTPDAFLSTTSIKLYGLPYPHYDMPFICHPTVWPSLSILPFSSSRSHTLHLTSTQTYSQYQSSVNRIPRTTCLTISRIALLGAGCVLISPEFFYINVAWTLFPIHFSLSHSSLLIFPYINLSSQRRPAMLSSRRLWCLIHIFLLL